MSKPASSSEVERVARLHALLVLDSAPEPVFDGIVKLASEICGAPIALLSLVDTQRQWFKANVGLTGVQEASLDRAFCAQAVRGDDLFVVPDATQDARFVDHPMVAQHPGIRFYAGAPLILPGGARVGALCVLDYAARTLTAWQADTLRGLAGIASQALLARQDLQQLAAATAGVHAQALIDNAARYRAMVESQTDLVSLAQSDGTLMYVNPAYARHFGRTSEDMIGLNLFDFIQAQDRPFVANQIAQALQSSTILSNENRMIAVDGSVRWVAWTNGFQRDGQGNAMLHSVGRDITDRKLAEQALELSQAALARTSRIAGIGGWQLELATGAVHWSDETRRIHEVEPDYVPTPQDALAFYTPEVRPLIESAVNACIRDGTPWDLEMPMVTAKGRAIWVRTQGQIELDTWKPAQLVGAFQDISERRQLQQRLADGERFVRQVTDSLPMRIAYIDRDLRFRFVNQVHCERFGRPRDEIEGRTLVELTGRVNPPEVLARLQAALCGAAQHFEFSETVGVVPRQFASDLIPDVGADGQVKGLYATGVDITERSMTERALRDLTGIIDNTSDYVVQTDWRGNIVFMNSAARKCVGVAPEQSLQGLQFTSFYNQESNRTFMEQIVPTVKDQDIWLGEATVLAVGGRELPVSLIVIAHRDAQGRVARYSSVMRDISAELIAKQAMARQAATLRSVAEAIPASVAVIGSDRRYRFVNSAFERWIGASRDHIVGRSLLQVLGKADHERSGPYVDRVLKGESVQFERSYSGRGGATHIAVSYIPLWMDDGTVDGFVGVLQDISQHKREEVRLLQLAQRDALTGLLNRGGFELQMEHAVKTGASATMALLYVDLDHFKPINDQHGHPVGDQLLRQFAQRMLALVRPTDFVARLGGDEFAVLLMGVRESANARMVAEKVVVTARMPFVIDGQSLAIGASVGVAFGVHGATGWPGLVARADAMLYAAKKAGRGRQAGEAVSDAGR